jgi:hypothetical protein
MLKFIAIITGVFIVGALIFITYSVTKDVKPRLKTMYVEQIGRLAQQFRYEQDAVFLSQITDKQMQSAIEMYKNLSEARSKRSYAEMKAVLDKYK